MKLSTLKLVWTMLLVILNSYGYGQNKMLAQNFSSAGTTSGVSSGTSRQLVSVVGQPASYSSNLLTQTQAGFMLVGNYIIVIIDTTPPTIIYTTTSQGITKGATTNSFSATITDNNSVTASKIFYRPIAGLAWSSADLVPGTSNSYSIPVQPTWYDGMGLEYYFTAQDGATPPNPQRSPTAGSYYATLTDATVNFTIGSHGNQKENYKIVSMPYDKGNNIINEIFTTTYKNSLWRLFGYNNALNKFPEYPGELNNFERGKGYWMIVKDPTTLFPLPSVDAPKDNRAALKKVTLNANKWNMVGNPYPVSIKWSEVLTLNSNSNIGSLKIFEAGFASGDELKPFEGGFVFLNGTVDVDIKIPFKGQTAEGGRTRINQPISDISSADWQVDLVIAQRNDVNKLGGFGMNRNARLQVDQFDDYNPPNFFNSVEILFPHPEHPLGKFGRDVVNTQDEFIWRFTADGEIGDPTMIQWNKDLGKGDKDLFLVDENLLKVVNMKEMSSHTFLLEKDHSFSIYFGRNIAEKIIPLKIRLIGPYPNPVAREFPMTFNIALPESPGEFSVELDLFDASGRAVKRDGLLLRPGFHQLNWEWDNTMATSGMYLYRVGVRSYNSQQVFTGKIILQ